MEDYGFQDGKKKIADGSNESEIGGQAQIVMRDIALLN
jgi:hypothetical protein